MPRMPVALLYESWADIDRAISGLTPDDATMPFSGGSSIAWTVGHITNMLDSWLVVRFQGRRPHPIIGNRDFRTGGSGKMSDWPVIVDAAFEVRAAAKSFLEGPGGIDLDRVIPYDGSIRYLRPVGLQLRYAVLRIAAHHFMHLGEILTVRSFLGHDVATIGNNPDWGKALLGNMTVPPSH